MNPLRRISSLQEDFAKLGLAPKSESRAPALTEERANRQPRREDKRRPSKAKSASAKVRTEQKAKFKMKMNSKIYESRIQKIAKLHGGKVNKQAQVKTESAQNLRQRATLLESLRDLTAELRGNAAGQVARGFRNVIGLAGTLLRKFAVVEEVMEDLGAPTVEHPGSAYPAEKTVTNISTKPKTGDAVEQPSDVSTKAEQDDPESGDTEDELNDLGDIEGWEDDDEEDTFEADDAEKKDNEDDETVGEQDERPASLSDTGEETEPEDAASEEDDEEANEEDDEEKTDMDEEEDPEDMSSEEDDPEKKKDEPTSESMVVNMSKLRTEAEDVLSRMKTSVLSPSDAAAVLQDMVSYLGGALKVYLDVAAEISKYAYAGADAPQPVGTSPSPVDNVNKYIGQDAPPAVGATPAPVSGAVGQ